VGVDESAAVASQSRIGKEVAIGPCAVVQPGAKIGDRTVICAGAFVGSGVTIGEDCFLAQGVVVQADCVLGNRVRVGPNSVIGSDGFGYFFEAGQHHRIPHAGNVVIEDDVELGACSCVDRAKFGSTKVGIGSKIDNLVQIAHNVQTGPGCLVAGQSGISGSTKLGAFVVMGGGTVMRDNISVADGTRLGVRGGLAHSVTKPGLTMAGTPAREGKQFMREFFALKKLPDLLNKVRDMEKRIKKIESTTND
jgi:UDP-3-O-[3-hydroxymyristoyl] glucosamine N-acyltransferase